MTSCSYTTLNDGTLIGAGERPYFVAEVNTSHFGDLDTAKQMIDSLKIMGCDCVKFQSWSEASLYSETYYEQNPIARRFIKKYQLTECELIELSQYCNDVGIAFSSTPYSLREAKFLVEHCSVPFLKISSMELTNLQYLRAISAWKTTFILSTGMGSIGEIERAVEILSSTQSSNLILLHCVSLYPTPSNLCNLRNISGLRDRFPSATVGFSDHTIGVEAAVASVALGASLIEKHFTLDSSKIGMDNQMATGPEGFAKMIQLCSSVHQSLGDCDRIVSDDELAQRTSMRRSVVTTRKVKAGEALSLSDLDLKRPGTGIPADEILNVVGRTVSRDLDADRLVFHSDLE